MLTSAKTLLEMPGTDSLVSPVYRQLALSKHRRCLSLPPTRPVLELLTVTIVDPLGVSLSYLGSVTLSDCLHLQTRNRSDYVANALHFFCSVLIYMTFFLT